MPKQTALIGVKMTAKTLAAGRTCRAHQTFGGQYTPAQAQSRDAVPKERGLA